MSDANNLPPELFAELPAETCRYTLRPGDMHDDDDMVYAFEQAAEWAKREGLDPEDGEDYLASALEGSTAQLWIIEDDDERVGCAVTEVTADTVRLVACSGVGGRQWVHVIATIEAWAREIGKARVVAWARPGWSRDLSRLGYRESHRVMERDVPVEH